MAYDAGMTVVMIGNGRALRVCDLCGGVDDHPRHVIAGAAAAFEPPSDEIVTAVLTNAAAADVDSHTLARLLRDLHSVAAQDRHMDCCRQAGCPTGACDQQTAGVESAIGAALLDHLVSLPSEVTG